MPEVAGEDALFIDPHNPTQIAEAVYKIISDQAVRDRLIALGQENIKKFSWEKCARETLKVITSISPPH
jgi:glycosyltransferase involved in cell wall biosynthesis